MPQVHAITAANRFIQLGIANGNLIDPMKLQKLVYIAHGWSLAKVGTGMIRESVEAWPYGPVVPSLYTTFKNYRSSNIDAPVVFYESQRSFNAVDEQNIEGVWDEYRKWTAIQLSMLTHEKGSAWDLTRKISGHGGPYSSPTIPASLIRDEFQRRLQGSGSLSAPGGQTTSS